MMIRSKIEIRFVLLLAAGAMLSGCQTDSNSPGPFASQSSMSDKPSEQVEAAKPAEPTKPEPPMTKSRAATECWMKTEKNSAGADIDKRADIVTKCIADKMKAVAAAPKT